MNEGVCKDFLKSRGVPKQLLGENIIPLGPKSKSPDYPWKKYQKKPYTNRKKLMDRARNLGVVCGNVMHPDKHLVVVDLDDKRYYDAFKDLETLTIQTGKKGYHLYFYSKIWDGARNRIRVPNHDIELIGGSGAFVVIPPSIHPETGKHYRVLKDCDVLEVDDVIDFVENILSVDIRRKPNPIEGHYDGFWGVLKVLTPYWREGHRNNLALAVTGIARKMRVEYQKAEKIFKEFLVDVGDNEIEARLRTLRETYEKPIDLVGGLTTLKGELKAMNIPDHETNTIINYCYHELGKGLDVKYQIMGDRWDKILSTIANHEKIKELTLKLEGKHKPTLGEVINPLAVAITENIKFVNVKRGETIESYYIDPETGYIGGPTKQVIEIITKRLLTVYGYSNTNLLKELESTIRAYTPENRNIEAGNLLPRGLTPLQDSIIVHDTLEAFDFNEALDKGIVFYEPLPKNFKYRDDLIRRIKAGNFNLEKEAPNFYKFLKRFFDDDNRRLLELTLGWVLAHQQTKRPLAFVIGPRDTGKSTLKEILTGVLGNRRAVTTSLESLHSRFGLIHLPLAWVVLSSEKPKNIIQSERMKRLTGGETEQIEEKHKTPYQAIIRALFMFFMNELPRIDGIDEALAGRIIIINTQNPLGDDEKDQEYVKKIIEKEGEAIFYWLLNCYHELKKEKFIIPTDVRMIMDLLKRAKTNIIGFKEDMLIEDPEAEVKATEIYESYTKWCLENDHEALGRNTMYQHLTTYTQAVRKTVHKTLYFVGVRLKNDGNADDDGNLKDEYQQALIKGDFDRFDDLQAKILEKAVEGKHTKEYIESTGLKKEDQINQTLRIYEKPPKIGVLAQRLSLDIGITIKEAEDLIWELIDLGKLEYKDGRVYGVEKETKEDKGWFQNQNDQT